MLFVFSAGKNAEENHMFNMAQVNPIITKDLKNVISFQ